MISFDKMGEYLELKKKQAQALVDDMEKNAVTSEQEFEHIDQMVSDLEEGFKDFRAALGVARQNFEKQHAEMHDRFKEFLTGDFDAPTSK